jgi:hypothetical protein
MCCFLLICTRTEIVAQDSILDSPYVKWGDDTNGFRAGTEFGQEEEKIVVCVLTSKEDSPNGRLEWFRPVDGKFAKVELKDINGMVIAPLAGKDLGTNLPKSIEIKDLGRVGDKWHGYWLTNAIYPLGTNTANCLGEFMINEVYLIESEGDYDLTIWPVIYQRYNAGPIAYRIPIAPTTRRIHLQKSAGPKSQQSGNQP